MAGVIENRAAFILGCVLIVVLGLICWGFWGS